MEIAQGMPKNQRRRNDNIHKICVLEGVGEGEIYGKLSQNAVFLGNSMTIKFGKFANFIVRNFVVIWEAPKKHNFFGLAIAMPIAEAQKSQQFPRHQRGEFWARPPPRGLPPGNSPPAVLVSASLLHILAVLVGLLTAML